MLKEKIIVTGLFETLMQLSSEWRDGVSGRAVPVDGVGHVAKVRSEIEAPAKPPNGRGVFVLGEEEANVGVARRHVGIAWMNHERNSERFPDAAGEFGTVYGRGGRELVAVDMRERYAGFFENGALGKDASAAATALRTRPQIFAEVRAAVFDAEGRANTLL